jgi:hypothetical protein
VIADQDTLPLFAVEFDGPHHEVDHNTSNRDKLKRSVCDSLGLPMLRIDAEYLQHRVGRFSLLGWLTELWFMEDACYAAQMEGSAPFDEPFFYSNFIGFGYMDNGHFVEIDRLNPEEQVELLIEHQGKMIVHRPYDPFISYRAFIMNSYEKGICLRPIPEQVTGTDIQGYELALAVLPVTHDRAVVGRARIRSFMFSPVSPRELAEELSVVDVARKLELYSKGEHRGLSNIGLTQLRVGGRVAVAGTPSPHHAL